MSPPVEIPNPSKPLNHPYRRTPIVKRKRDLESIDQDITQRLPIDSEDPEYKALRLARSPQPRKRGATVLNKPRKPMNTI